MVVLESVKRLSTSISIILTEICEDEMRNYIAKDLRTPKYRKRIKKNPKEYTRKVKHKR
jgi:hypothetical protein